MFESRAYTVQMVVEVPDTEKQIADKASDTFELLLSKIKMAIDHLNIIYDPLYELSQIDSDEIVEGRVILRKYKKKTKKVFESLLKTGYRAVALMSAFSTDSDVEELMNSFIENLKELEKQVNYLLSIFSNLNNPEFQNQLIFAIDSVKRQCSQLKQLVNDRILEHIDTNILAKNWESLVNDKYQNKMNDKTPYMVQLYNERQNSLK